MKLYIAGAISSDPHYVDHFLAGKTTVEAAGHKAILPPNLRPATYDHEAFMKEHNGNTPLDILRGYLKQDLAALLDSDGIALLPSWKNSTGAGIEACVARGVGSSVFFISEDYTRLTPEPVRHPASQRFHSLLQEMGELHDKKQKDYGSDTDPFANVRGSAAWDIPPWIGAMVRATDKVKRLQSFARKGELANEGVIDSFMDLAVYSIIARVLYEEEDGRIQKTS